VLLILAGISIAMLSGENSILTRGAEARNKTGDSQVVEKIRIANASAITRGNGELTYANLKEELTEQFGEEGEETWQITEEDTNPWIVTVTKYGTYTISHRGVTLVPTPEVAALPTTAGTKPYLPGESFHRLDGTDLENGLVITDATDENPGNEYVWIEVPNDGTGPTYTAVQSAEDYTEIASALRAYTAPIITEGTSSGSNKTTTYGYKDELKKL